MSIARRGAVVVLLLAWIGPVLALSVMTARLGDTLTRRSSDCAMPARSGSLDLCLARR